MIECPEDDYDDDDETDGSGLRERLESLLPNVIRRTVSTGVGAKQYTEDVIKNALQDRMMPKEVVSYIVDLADNTKGEVVRVAAREFRQFLDSAKFNQELAKVLTTLSFEIRTEIRFIPNDQAVKPSVKPSVETSARMKSSGKPIDAAPGTTEKINDAVRASATELSEMILGRLFRAVADDMEEPVKDAPESAAPPSPAEPETEPEPPAEEAKPKRRRRAAKKMAADS